MKALQVINSLKMGGAEMLVKHFALHAQSNPQWQVDLCTLYDTNDPDNSGDIAQAGLCNWHFKAGFPYHPWLVMQLKKLIEQNQYDVVHAHLFPTSAITALCSLLLKGKVAWLMTEHSTDNRRRKLPFWQGIDAAIYYRFDQIICISKPVQSAFLTWIPGAIDKTRVIHNGIPMDRAERVETIKKQYDALFVGRLISAKGVDLLLDALARIKQEQNRELILAIAGDGPMKGLLIKKAQQLKIVKSVHFLGFCREIDSLMRRAKVVVLPARSEGLSLVLLEAMKNKCPIIATRVGGIPELVQDGKNGLLVTPECPDCIARSIIYLLDNEKVAIRLAEEGYRKVNQHFSIDRYAKDIFDCYEEIIKMKQSKK